jgi:3-methyladenine DNA glycosylase/8-oxoguanine DNA glycosylase
MCRTAAVVETIVPFILEQKVTAVEAKRGWRRLASAWGEPAPGPAAAPVTLPPAPERLAAEPYWNFHRFGIEQKRADIIRGSCRLGSRLEEVVEMGPEDAARRMLSVPGIGPWTAGLVSQVALGNPDAVVVGDYHFPHIVSFTLTGERKGSDERMLELLEPYRPWRGLAQRLIISRGRRPERRAPKAQLRDLRAI